MQRVAGNFHVAVHMEDFIMLDRVGCAALSIAVEAPAATPANLTDRLAAQTQRALALALRNQRADHPQQPLDGEEGGLNMTHTIHKLQFGAPVRQLTHPLDGRTPSALRLPSTWLNMQHMADSCCLKPPTHP